MRNTGEIGARRTIPILNLFNPIATRTTALLWIGVWRIGDVLSTLLAHHTTGPRFQEANRLINALEPVVGFDAAVLLVAPLPLLIVYYGYRMIPVFVEIMAVMLPMAVIGNTLIVAGAYQMWWAWIAVCIVFLTGYVVYAEYQEYRRYGSIREFLANQRPSNTSISDLKAVATATVLWEPAHSKGDTQ